MDLKITNTWAEMSEEWVAEETGRCDPRRTVRMPTNNSLEDEPMEIDLEGLELNLRPSSTQLPSPTLPASYSAAVQKDPRPEIIYEELISTLPERLLPMGLPKTLTNRLKVIVDCESEVQKPTNPSSVKARLGVAPVLDTENTQIEDGEINSVCSTDNDSEDESDGDDENNLEAGWCKRLVAPRMKMYADEEAKKQKTQVRALITRSHQGQSYNSRHNSQSTSRDEFRRVKPYGGPGRIEKAYPNVTRRAPVNSRLGRHGTTTNRRGQEEHDDRVHRSPTASSFERERRLDRDGRPDRVERNFGSLEYKDENVHRQGSQRVPVKDRLGIRR